MLFKRHQLLGRAVLRAVCPMLVHSGVPGVVRAQPAVDSQDDLHLRLDDERVRHCEPVQHLGQLHELLPPPVMLLLAETVQRVCIEGHMRARSQV